MTGRQRELIAGVLAFKFGIAVLLLLAMAVIFEHEPLSRRAVVYLAVMMLCLAGVALGAYLHAKHNIWAGRLLLWLSTAVLVPSEFYSFAFAPLFVPSACLAVYASTARIRDNVPSSTAERTSGR